MELRVVLEGAHRSSEGGLARRTHEAAGPGRCGVHPAAARSAGQPGGDVVTSPVSGGSSAVYAAPPRCKSRRVAASNLAAMSFQFHTFHNASKNSVLRFSYW